MSKINDGGPAFPLPFIFDADRGESGMYIDGADAGAACGMTLRDYFAGQVLAGLIGSRAHSLDFHPASDADYCYRVADAMLAAREVKS